MKPTKKNAKQERPSTALAQAIRKNRGYQLTNLDVGALKIRLLDGHGIGIYETHGDGQAPGSQQRVMVRNWLEAEALARALAERFGAGKFKVIRSRNSEGRFT